MGVQASIYEHEKFADLSDFFDSTDKALSTPELRAVYDELVRLRAPKA
jgi:hypothetical protein